MEKLRQMMRSTYNAHMLSLATDAISPGRLLETHWGWGWPWNSNPTFRRPEGLAWEVLPGETAELYPTLRYETSIIEGTFQDRIDLDAGFPLAQLGLVVGAGFSSSRRVAIDIGGIYARSFERVFDGHFLRKKLRGLREQHPEIYKFVDDDFLVTWTYHAADLAIEFDDKGEGTAKAELEAANVTFSLKADWESEYRLRLEGVAAAPFAVQGLRV